MCATPFNKIMQIEADLRQRIHVGQWLEGAMLPSRSALAKEYGVSINTVQGAIATLLKDGTLMAVNRRGTFVAHTIPRITDGQFTGVSDRAHYRNKPLLAPFKSDVTLELGTLGVLAPIYLRKDGSDDPSSWASYIIRSLEREFAAECGRTFFYNTLPQFGPYPGLKSALHAALDRKVDALLVINCEDYPGWTDEIIALSSQIKIPFLYIAADDTHLPFPMLYYDQRSSGYLAAEHLLQSGYKSIYVVKPFNAPWFDERIEGIQYAMRLGNISNDHFRIISCETIPAVYDYVAYSLDDQHLCNSKLVDICIDEHYSNITTSEPFAIIAPNDAVAKSVLARLHARNICAGKNVGVVGFDDIPAARHLELTTIPPPLEIYGKTAASLLARAMRGEDMINRTGVGSYLIPRNSTHLK